MNGALIIDKPARLTSHDVVARVRRIIGERRIGHTGTLDPFATGVLVLLVGGATRLAQFLSTADKEYEAVVRLGYQTDTGDLTGLRLENGPHAKPQNAQSLGKEKIEAAVSSLRGEIEQTPPMYSAKKVGGRKLYELARRGEEIERQPVRVTIHEFQTLGSLATNDDGSADLRVRVVCSAGTYIRTLAEDLGKNLGSAAHLAELRRTRAGRFTVEESITLEQLEELTATGSLPNKLICSRDTLSHFPLLKLDETDARRVLNGNHLKPEAAAESTWNHDQAIRLCDPLGELLGVGFYDKDRGLIHPRVVMKQTD
jgi:tRNA pseudouridine55 synthase